MDNNEPNNLEEARAATEELFSGEPETIPAGDETDVTPDTETPKQENATDEGQNTNNQNEVLDDAVSTAEAAAKAAAEKDAQLTQALQESEALRQQNSELKRNIEEISKKNEEHIIEEALKPPTLDLSSLTFASDEEQQAAMAKYAEELSAYNRQELLKELEPTLKFAEKGMHDAEAKEAVEVLSQVPELAGIEKIRPQLDKIIANNKWLQSEDMPIDEKYINAYAIAKGIDSINNPVKAPEPPKEPTSEEILEMYRKNPDLQALIEKERLGAIKQGQQVPPFSASSGAAGAALNIKNKPKTLEEASEMAKELLGEM